MNILSLLLMFYVIEAILIVYLIHINNENFLLEKIILFFIMFFHECIFYNLFD